MSRYPPGMSSIHTHFDVLAAALRDWAAAGFPQAWPLLTVGNQPTRLLPVRLLEADECDERDVRRIGLRLNGHRAGPAGMAYFPLQLTISVPDDPEMAFVSITSNALDLPGPPTRWLIEMEVPTLGAPLPHIADWILGRLRSAADATNRTTVALMPTLRASEAVPAKPAPTTPRAAAPTPPPSPAQRQRLNELQTALAAWAAAGFPQAWPVLEFADEPTRFVPARLLETGEVGEPGAPGVLINAYPVATRGTRHFQLRIVIPVFATASDDALLARCDLLSPGHPPRSVITDIVPAAVPRHDLGRWIQQRLESCCTSSNTYDVATKPAIRPTPR